MPGNERTSFGAGLIRNGKVRLGQLGNINLFIYNQTYIGTFSSQL